MSQVPSVIAYPINGNESASPSKLGENSLDTSFLSLGLGPSNYGDDTSLDLGGNFFSQLDSMIQAVKVESSALDSMRDKLKEVDNLRNQISAFTKRLIDADQNNLNLKANLMKSQEQYNELKKQKAEMESNMVPLRQELNRTKEQLNKERMMRQQMQQEMMMLKEQYARLEQLRDNLDREVKTIPALTESNEILKNDLMQLRKRFREEKMAMQKHIKALEGQGRDADLVRAEVRQLAMRMMDLSSGNTLPPNGTTMNNAMNNGMNGAGNGASNPMMMSYGSQTTSNSVLGGVGGGVGGGGGNVGGYNSMQSIASMGMSYDYDEEDDDEGTGSGQEQEYDHHSYIDDMVGSSLDSLPSQQQQQQQQQAPLLMGGSNGVMMSARGTGNTNGAVVAKKKKVKKRMVASNSSGRLTGNGENNFNLPRIHG